MARERHDEHPSACVESTMKSAADTTEPLLSQEGHQRRQRHAARNHHEYPDPRMAREVVPLDDQRRAKPQGRRSAGWHALVERLEFGMHQPTPPQFLTKRCRHVQQCARNHLSQGDEPDREGK